ncbi:MAG: hypothetical protein H6741_17655 [Alphaproteobacteria bacterium]|nr:hypothetical protein [Alphaproteobacteria bacterium]MCB9794545.1 hypothetical protein [Alphaproteobacteria bacterium]
MPLPRPVHALSATALACFAYLAPWTLGALGSGPAIVVIEDLPEVQHERLSFRLPPPPPPEPVAPVSDAATPERVEAPLPSAEPEALAEGSPDGLLQSTLVTRGPGRFRAKGLVDKPPEPRKLERQDHQPQRSRETKECDPPDERVAEVNDTAFRIERGLLDYYANHIQEIEDLAASWWARDEDDNRVGFRIGRMKCGALLRQAGFRNGDVITGINGMTITTWTEGVKAYLAVRNKNLLWVDVERRGEDVRLDYLLVDDGGAALAIAEGDRWEDPSVLVERELELAELPWLQRRLGKRDDRRDARVFDRAERKAEKERERTGQAKR